MHSVLQISSMKADKEAVELENEILYWLQIQALSQ